MLRKIEALRKEPKSVRNRYAFGFAMAATLVVAFVWMLSLPSRFDNVSVASESAERGSDSIGDFKETLSEIGNILSGSLNEIQTQAGLLESAPINATSSNSMSTSSFFATTSVRATNDSSIEN